MLTGSAIGEQPRRAYTLELILLVLAPLWVYLPLLIGYPYALPLRALLLIPYVAGIARGALRVGRGKAARVDGPLALLLVSYIGVVSFSYLRALLDARGLVAVTADSWAVFVILSTYALVTFLSFASGEEHDRLRTAVLAGLVLYLAANLVLHAVGFRVPESIYHRALPASLLQWLGLRVDTIAFPLAASINSAGVLAGGTAAMAAGFLIGTGPSRCRSLLAISGILLGVAVMVLTDVRAELVFLVGVLALLAAPGARIRQGLPILPLLAVLAPLVYLVGLQLMPDAWWTSYGEGARQAASLSNRETVWRVVWSELASPDLSHGLGYGYLGQIVSGLSEAYRGPFSAYVYSEQVTAHNAFLQTVIETGYVGAGIVLSLQVMAIARLVSARRAGAGRITTFPSLSFLMLLSVAGITESAWSPQFLEVQVAMMMVLASAVSLPDHHDAARGASTGAMLSGGPMGDAEERGGPMERDQESPARVARGVA